MSRKKSKLKMGASAKIEASAKLSFQRKRTTTEIVPPDVTRAKASSWLDLISPFTEWAGLRGGALRYRRAQLRIQQEKTLSILAGKVRDTMGGVHIVQPVPSKILVPLLEKASLENPTDSEMINLWSNLLVAATEKKSIPPRFVTIVGELNGDQARLFLEISRKHREKVRHPSLFPEQAAYTLQQQNIENSLTHALHEHPLDIDQFYSTVISEFEIPGAALCDLIVNDIGGGTISLHAGDAEFFADVEYQTNLQILASIGLLEKVDIHRQVNGAVISSVSIHYFYVTELGCDFLEAVLPKDTK